MARRLAGTILGAALLAAGSAAAQPVPPRVDAISPAKRLPGELLNVRGANLGAGTRVDFVGTTKGAAPVHAALAVRDERLSVVRAAVPRLPPGRYKVRAGTQAGSADGKQLLTVVAPPKGRALAGPARQALGAKLAAMFRRHGETGWIPAAVAQKLAGDAAAGRLGDLQEALAVEEAAVIADAAKTAGPIAQNIVLLAYRTGQPIGKVAAQWRHCHVAGPVGAALALDAACGRGSRPHAHLVVRMDSSLANRDVLFAAERGTRPPRIAAHAHTEHGFEAGWIEASPSDPAGWYDGDEALPDVLRWLDGHAPAVRPGLALALPATAAVIACTTALDTCPMTFAQPTHAALKEAAMSLVAEGVVNAAPVAREKAIELLSGIQP